MIGPIKQEWTMLTTTLEKWLNFNNQPQDHDSLKKKKDHRELHKKNIHDRAAIAKTFIPETSDMKNMVSWLSSKKTFNIRLLQLNRLTLILSTTVGSFRKKSK